MGVSTSDFDDLVEDSLPFGSAVNGPELRTERLILRRWAPSDLAPFAELNSHPRVTEFLPSVPTREESNAMVDRIECAFAEHGFGLWAVEVPGVTRFAGFVGLSLPRFSAHFTPAVEVGWRLAPAFWGRGYATEGALAAVGFGLDTLQLDEIVSFTTEANLRSRRVMERIGMTHDPADDFDHPLLPPESALRRHVLYRIGLGVWTSPPRSGAARGGVTSPAPIRGGVCEPAPSRREP
jgi:RimJ/RimL family protein N-acetyltransferase